MKTTMIAGLLGLGMLLGAGTARAGELDVCHVYAEALYRETMAATAGEADLEAQRLYEDAHDDCVDGERNGSLFAPGEVGGLDSAARAFERDLVECPWGSADGECL